MLRAGLVPINSNLPERHVLLTSCHPTFFCRLNRCALPNQNARRQLLPALGSSIDPETLTDREIPLSSLQKQLENAIDNEDYGAAAQLRDEIDRRRFDHRLAVEEANDAFYSAFQSGSLAEMSAIWGKGEHVQCIHPASGCIAGRQRVMDGWKLILGSGRLKIKLDQVRIYATESYGYVTCIEVMDAGDSQGRVMATNIFEKQNGKWKIIHHHGGPLPRMA